jgi:membrane-bound lytic murein transglycosylase B
MVRVSTGPVARVVLAAIGVMTLLVCLLAVAVLKLGGARPPSADAQLLEPVPTSAGQPVARTASRTSSRDPSRRSARVLVDPAWVTRIATRAGIPVPAMRAYADAELVVRAEQPACHLSWNTLAGIGWIESQHGTDGGRTLLANGRASRPVLGPALDGSSGYAAIHATPGSSAWHDDAVWEHAVGPLQFLASTWDRWGADGDGDGVADPRDLDDAALAAARYLCADGHDLATDSGWNAAVHSYTHDADYVARVAAAANTYVGRTS